MIPEITQILKEKSKGKHFYVKVKMKNVRKPKWILLESYLGLDQPMDAAGSSSKVKPKEDSEDD